MRIPILLALLLATVATAAAQTPKPQYVISVTRGGTPLGNITIELFPDIAPKHVRNFDSLVSVGFYNGTAFHRVIPGFMIQGGSFYSKGDEYPKDWWGWSDDSQTRVPAEFSTTPHKRGIISMAREPNNINSGTSQFFICVANAFNLDGDYSVFGQVLEGMDVVDSIVKSPRDAGDAPLQKVEMTVTPKAVATVGAEEMNPAAWSIEATPNPAYAGAQLRYTMPVAGRAEVSLYDETGREVARLLDLEQEAGTHLLPLNVEDLPSGAYTARLRSGGHIGTCRLLLVR